MAIKENIEGNLKQKDCTSVVSLDVRGAFDTAWWPSILRNLKEFKCPKNFTICEEVILAIERHRYAEIR
jgi:hypothetical protein